MLSMNIAFRHASRLPKWNQMRYVSTLEGSPYIYVFPNTNPPNKSHTHSHTLSLLPTNPPNPQLAIGTTTTLPPRTDTFFENPNFLKTLQDVLHEHAYQDPDAKSQAHVMASTSGTNMVSGGFLLNRRGGRKRTAGGDFSSGASGQGGAGSVGRGGWIHIYDSRRPPEYGRIPWPEDIFGSLEVDGEGNFVGGNGNYQPSGTYRTLTRDGLLGLSPFLREKLVQKLREQERQ